MIFLGFAIFILIGLFVYHDYKKHNNEIKRCPNCKSNVASTFDLNTGKSGLLIPRDAGMKKNIVIYKCNLCGFSWNHSVEVLETNT